MTFTALYRTRLAPLTHQSKDPYRHALMYVAHVRCVLGRTYKLECLSEYGFPVYRVSAPGLETMAFVSNAWADREQDHLSCCPKSGE